MLISYLLNSSYCNEDKLKCRKFKHCNSRLLDFLLQDSELITETFLLRDQNLFLEAGNGIRQNRFPDVQIKYFKNNS